jgi:hypothetical protein
LLKAGKTVSVILLPVPDVLYRDRTHDDTGRGTEGTEKVSEEIWNIGNESLIYLADVMKICKALRCTTPEGKYSFE